ncbi:MAG: hypothetical protein DWQ05_05950 [Calditrichaeota bacterium]|nr:MAG: hypothetical protein DWQ05_05950 [Calditrichota bacterium]
MEAQKLSNSANNNTLPVIGVFATCDPRIDADARKRAQNIIKMAADILASNVKSVDQQPIPVVYSDTLVDGEKEADVVARQFKEKGVSAIVCVPDTWAFPQLTVLSLLSHFPADMPFNMTCGNSGPRPGVVFTHAVSGAISQYGGMVHINVGNWPDTGLNPEMSEKTAADLVDWAYAAITYQGLKGRRVVVFGHDSMGMETALAHVLPIRNQFGIEITRLDMKLLADMLQKKAYDEAEQKRLRSWLDEFIGGGIEINTDEHSANLNTSLAMYLIMRDLMQDLNAVGGGFMSQLEWGSDSRGLPLPVADVMESLFNSTFDHNGPKAPVPFATEADVQGLLTMLFMTHLSAGNPPLFMDFRKVWENWEIKDLAKEIGVKLNGETVWEKRGFVDGDNSGSASFDWAAKPGTAISEILKNIRLPQVGRDYFPGGGNAVNFISPGGIEGIAARLAFSSLSGMFSMVWDEAETQELPAALAQAVSNTSTPIWPHTFITPKHASMGEYKQFAPANHFHMTWNLNTARFQYWMDLANVLSVAPWQEMPAYRENIDRPQPLLYLLNGGEDATKRLRRRG